jgi:hypothetical protein
MRLARRGLAVALFAGVAACGGDSTESKGEVFKLSSMNGSSLPYEEDDGFGGTTVTRSGSITLLSGNRFTARIAGSYTDDEGSTNWSTTLSGTYEHNEDTGEMEFTTTKVTQVEGSESDTFDLDPPIVFVATRDGNTITVSDPALGEGTAVFTK